MFIFQFHSTLHSHFVSEFFSSLKICSVDSTLFKLIQICSNTLKWLGIYVTLTLSHDFVLLFGICLNLKLNGVLYANVT